MAMRSSVTARKCSKIRTSASASIAAVGSSSTSKSAPSRMNARESAIFCHWPPESSRPPWNHLPSCVRYPSGSSAMNGAAVPTSAAARQRVSSRHAPTSPTPMFSPTMNW